MAYFTFSTTAAATLHQKHLFFITLCKFPSSLNFLNHHYLSYLHTPLFLVRSTHAKLETTDHEGHLETMNYRTREKKFSGFSSMRDNNKRILRKSMKKFIDNSVVEKEGKNVRNDLGFKRRREMGSVNSKMRSKDRKKERNGFQNVRSEFVNGELERENKRGGDNGAKKDKIKKQKADPTEVKLRVRLDMCSKSGDVMGAIQFYDLAKKEGIKMGQYHYSLLLYLCSSAALGIVKPAKSGNENRSSKISDISSGNSSVKSAELNGLVGLDDKNVSRLSFSSRNSGISDKMEADSNGSFNELNSSFGDKEDLEQDGSSKLNSQQLDGLRNHDDSHDDDHEIRVSEDIKKYALQRGLDIYNKMCADNVPMSEASLTAMARMAMSMGDSDMAFDMVKKMKQLGINPKLRSYGPALSVFCNSGDVDKAFVVEKHMLEHGIQPEESELEALLRVSVKAGKGDKVYYVLHKLRTTVRQVSPSTAGTIVRWFKSTAASQIGKRKWDLKIIHEAMDNGGGGWHGQGWLGKGKWKISSTSVGPDGFCTSCGERLATIDLDPVETENFAESVASIAIKRDKDSSFQKFQKWLDYYGPFEAVVDGANVGMFSQKRFRPSKINNIVNGIRHKLPSKRWPLIILHNRRVIGHKMNQPVNKALTEKWKNADALYLTPTGSNDDWYWLYAAIKFKCLVVTNDEMRDHTFQLLGNDFFPKWKERHQVHFSFSDAGPEFHMPPPYSVIIQESEKGHWHIPISAEHDYEADRAWLCVTRSKSNEVKLDSATTRPQESQSIACTNGKASSNARDEVAVKPEPSKQDMEKRVRKSSKDVYKNIRNILSESAFSHHRSILPEIEAAEELGDCVIDFQI